jgi:hypothetical protein
MAFQDLIKMGEIDRQLNQPGQDGLGMKPPPSEERTIEILDFPFDMSEPRYLDLVVTPPRGKFRFKGKKLKRKHVKP